MTETMQLIETIFQKFFVTRTFVSPIFLRKCLPYFIRLHSSLMTKSTVNDGNFLTATLTDIGSYKKYSFDRMVLKKNECIDTWFGILYQFLINGIHFFGILLRCFFIPFQIVVWHTYMMICVCLLSIRYPPKTPR